MIAMLVILFWFSLGLIGYTYFIYPLVLIFLWKFGKRSCKPIIGDSLPFVSLIVAAYNEENEIEDKILNSLALDYPRDKLEILIGSDGSNDQTNEILSRYQGQITTQIWSERRGKISVLNDLVGMAKGEILVFTDANTKCEQTVIRYLVGRLIDTRVGCVCGKLKLEKFDKDSTEMEGVYWRYENFLKKLEGDIGILLGANGGIYAIRKELYTVLPPGIIVDDFVIPMRILEQGFRVEYEPDAIAIEKASRTIADETKRKIRIGAGDYQALCLFFSMLNPIRGVPSLVFLSHKVLRWLVPFFLIIILVCSLILGDYLLFFFFLMCQLAFYFIAFLIYCCEKRSIKIFGGAYFIYYFVAMNCSLFVGFFRFVLGKQKVTWEKVSRL